MPHRETVQGTVADFPVPEHRYRCACCEGTIEVPLRETIPNGLDHRFSFIVDECELICSGCTSRLIEANAARMAVRRK
jgi:hypothetical protein